MRVGRGGARPTVNKTAWIQNKNTHLNMTWIDEGAHMGLVYKVIVALQ